jgi:hypothetical protein
MKSTMDTALPTLSMPLRRSWSRSMSRSTAGSFMVSSPLPVRATLKSEVPAKFLLRISSATRMGLPLRKSSMRLRSLFTKKAPTTETTSTTTDHVRMVLLFVMVTRSSHLRSGPTRSRLVWWCDTCTLARASRMDRTAGVKVSARMSALAMPKAESRPNWV